MSNEAFDVVYESDSIKQIEFIPAWRSDNNHYQNATKERIDYGVILKSYDTERLKKLILVGTRFGTVVVFERHPDGDAGVILADFHDIFPEKLRTALHANSSLSHAAIQSLIGDEHGSESNVGAVIESIADQVFP